MFIRRWYRAIADYGDSADVNFPISTGSIGRRVNSEKKRHVKIGHFKSLIESKIFSKSDRDLQQIGLHPRPEEKQFKDDVSMVLYSLCVSNPFVDRIESSLGPFRTQQNGGNSLESDTRQLSRSASVISTKSETNLVKGKSMPSLT